jgi:CHAT domain-containing protein
LLRSGIAFAGANKRQSGEDDGILTAFEAAALDLWGTKLVVLSACDTGNGEVKNGEGVFGLRRALVLAGAETQVSSLWKADDKVTRKMMERF